MVSRMRPTLICSIALAVLAPSCSQPPANGPSPTVAALIVNGPSSVATRVCQPCGNGDLEVAADIVVRETGGVAGQITGLEVLLRAGAAVLAGPGQYNAANVQTFAGSNRVAARG